MIYVLTDLDDDHTQVNELEDCVKHSIEAYEVRKQCLRLCFDT